MLATAVRSRLTARACFSTSTQLRADFTHAVIGAGVVGLAIARQLAARENTSVLLIEKHGDVGQETSSRNSEVIHAGLYYAPESLKTKLCLRGKELLYDLCEKQGIPHRNTGKWIVAQDERQMEECEKVHRHAQSIGCPTHFITLEEGKRREPNVLARAGILESPTTGIVDSHTLMQYLHGSFEERGGDTAFLTSVKGIEALDNGKGGYRLLTSSSPSSSDTPDASTAITVETLINSAGLYAIPISNMVLPPSRHRTPAYAKGTYFSYALSRPRPQTLIYPAPVPGHGGLGTHLTLDLGGKIRFGPDVEWVDSPTSFTPSGARLPEALKEIQSYLPDIDPSAVALDYCGIRPKLTRGAAVAVDWYIEEEEGFNGFVNLLGIESPGLTGSLAIAELVEEILYGPGK